MKYHKYKVFCPHRSYEIETDKELKEGGYCRRCGKKMKVVLQNEYDRTQNSLHYEKQLNGNCSVNELPNKEVKTEKV